MVQLFEAIAEEEKAEFIFNNELYSLGDDATTPEKIFKLAAEHKGADFWIRNILGTQAVGEAELLIKSPILLPEFEIKSKSHFASIFSRKKSRLKIHCENPTLDLFLHKSPELSLLHDLIKETQFEPYITGENKLDGFLIRTEYHLQFVERTEVIRPLFHFYKKLIDQLSN